MLKSAFITGVTGQDGSYLAELLLDKDYKVYGLIRRASVDTTERIRHLVEDDRFVLLEGDITDPSTMYRLMAEYKPDEVYNLAAMSHVGSSFDQPATTFSIDAVGVLNILEAIRQVSPQSKFYQASTSELFGDTTESPQNENTPLKPRSPYAVAKAAAHHLVTLYRQAYGIFACSGILFNHESPRRGDKFVTRKITQYIAKFVVACERDEVTFDADGDPTNFPSLLLGNLDARRDWGHAEDYVRAMWLMLQQPGPKDFVVASGETRTIREFLTAAFNVVGLPWEPFVEVSSQFFRPADVNLLCGDATQAREVLGWKPDCDFTHLVEEMVISDINREGVVWHQGEVRI